MDSIYQAIIDLEKNSQFGALCTVVHTTGSTPRHSTSKMLVYPDGSIQGTVGGGELENRVIQDAITTIHTNISKLVEFSMVDPKRGDVGICGGTVKVFIEPIVPAPLIVVIGAGHVGKAVVHLAKWMGFRVAVSDDRPDICTPDAIPDADQYYPCKMDQLPGNLSINGQTYLIMTTRGSSTDVEGLPPLLNTSASYIGIIGSKRRWSETKMQLKKKGISDEELSKVYSPIGININAETPEEIAVSILAEVLMVVRKGTHQSKKFE